MRVRRRRTVAVGNVALVVAMALGCDGRRGEDASSSTASAPAATAAAAASQAGAPATAASAMPTDSAASTQLREHLGPFTLEGVKYFVDIERYVSAPDTGVKRVVVRDSAGRVLFEEDVAAIVAPSDASWALMEAAAHLIEDARGRPRALQFTYWRFVSAAVEESDVRSEAAIRFVAPRGNTVKPIAPLLKINGRPDTLPDGSRPSSRRLLEGDRFVVEGWRSYYTGIVPYHVNFQCATGAQECIVVAAPDSIAGRARFRVVANPDRISESTKIELFPLPGGTPDTITIERGTEVEILEGAALKLDSQWEYDATEEDWLRVRVNGRTGWIASQDFSSIGLDRRLW